MNNESKSYRDSKNRLDTYSVAEQLLKDYHVISLNDRLYIYNNGVYEDNLKELESAIRRLGRGAKTAEINSTFDNLFSMAPAREESGYELVAFNNCIVNFRTLETFDFDPDKYVITSRVFADYGVDADASTVQLVDRFFNDITDNDVELRDCLFEIIGYCMLRTAMYHRAFILKGNANNGKSDYIHIIDSLIGAYCTHQDLTQLSTLSNLKKLYHHTANLIDDVMELTRVDFDKIHSIITGGKIATKSTGEIEFSFRPYSTLVLATTHNLDFSSCNDETLRRFKVVPFNTKFDSSTVDRYMTQNITAPSSLNVIATRAIQAVSRLDKEWEFPTVVENTTVAYFSEGNPVLAFGKAYPIKRIISVDDYYTDFCVWYIDIFGVQPNISKAVFGKRLSELLNIKSIPHTIQSVKDTYYQAKDFEFEKFRQQYEDYCKSLDNGQSPMSVSKYAKSLDKQDENQEHPVVTEG